MGSPRRLNFHLLSFTLVLQPSLVALTQWSSVPGCDHHGADDKPKAQPLSRPQHRNAAIGHSLISSLKNQNQKRHRVTSREADVLHWESGPTSHNSNFDNVMTAAGNRGYVWLPGNRRRRPLPQESAAIRDERPKERLYEVVLGKRSKVKPTSDKSPVSRFRPYGGFRLNKSTPKRSLEELLNTAKRNNVQISEDLCQQDSLCGCVTADNSCSIITSCSLVNSNCSQHAIDHQHCYIMNRTFNHFPDPQDNNYDYALVRIDLQDTLQDEIWRTGQSYEDTFSNVSSRLWNVTHYLAHLTTNYYVEVLRTDCTPTD